ncbi:MAG TPA: hypothetical protein VD993_00055 [Chitinophagaceae bacterium]|nr:hypothetical protein [Chitinophagaceae bacterium]
MKKEHAISRRMLVRSTIAGFLVAAVPNIVYAKNSSPVASNNGISDESQHDRYPAIKLEIASEVVGVSHFNLDRLKELVDPRPELAKAEWDWGFGDWESAIGAASHVGRKDIVDYLIKKGAVPTIFTYAMLGEYEIVKAMIDAHPGIQRNFGPHGITLLQHARTGSQTEGVDKVKSQRLVDYLRALGDADGRQYLSLEEKEKAKYLGDYKYGEGKDDGFTIKLNMRKLLALGKLGKSGGALLRIGENEFTYQGAPSVVVKFLVRNDRVISLTLQEPGLTLTATKI